MALPTALIQGKRIYLIAGLAALLVVVAVVAFPLFAPKASTFMEEAAPEGGQVLKQGSWRDGDAAHHASGTVMVLRTADGGHVLRFEDYDATAGPDVYFYLTPTADARSTEAVESGLRVLVPGGADEGEATLRGDFNVPLPADFDPDAYQGIAAWCDRFNVLFGNAPLA